MTEDQSQELCRQLFLQEAAAGRKFYAVNQPYSVHLRLATAEELQFGIPTQEAQSTKVQADEIIITRLDDLGESILLTSHDGFLVADQWVSDQPRVSENFSYEVAPTDTTPVLAKRKPGRPCAYIRLPHRLITMHGRGPETWPAGSYMSCWNEETMHDFTSISEISFAQMKAAADEASAKIFLALNALRR